MKAELEYNAKAILGEGPVWNHITQELVWVDIEKGTLNLYNPVTKNNNYFELREKVGCAIPTNQNTYICAIQSGIVFYSVVDGSVSYCSKIENELKNNRFNDGKCDARGRLWVGSMDMESTPYKGALYMIKENLIVEKKNSNITVSNGLAWSLDHKTMYFIDSFEYTITAFDFDIASGALSNPRIIIKVPQHFGAPDGMTIDTEGMLWVAHWNGYCVRCWDPLTGEVLATIAVPVPLVTSCAFGGADLDTLYITTASTELTKAQLKKHPLSGGIFQAKVGAKGMEASFF